MSLSHCLGPKTVFEKLLVTLHEFRAGFFGWLMERPLSASEGNNPAAKKLFKI